MGLVAEILVEALEEGVVIGTVVDLEGDRLSAVEREDKLCLHLLELLRITLDHLLADRQRAETSTRVDDRGEEHVAESDPLHLIGQLLVLRLAGIELVDVAVGEFVGHTGVALLGLLTLLIPIDGEGYVGVEERGVGRHDAPEVSRAGDGDIDEVLRAKGVDERQAGAIGRHGGHLDLRGTHLLADEVEILSADDA